MTRIFVITFTFATLLINGQSKAQSGYSQAVKNQAEQMWKSMVKKDFQSFIQYMYPQALQLMGGKDKVIKTLQKGAVDMEKEGTGFLNVNFGEPSVLTITEKGQMQCTIPETIEMKVPNGKLVSTSTLIALSDDKGKRWYFIDSYGDILTMRKSFPQLSSKLVIPPKPSPIFYPQ